LPQEFPRFPPFQRTSRRANDSPLLHLIDGQSFAPLTAMGLGQVREWTLIGLKAAEPLEHCIAHCRREAGVHLGYVDKFTAFIIANQDSIEIPAARRVAADHEFARLKHAHLLPGAGALARLVQAIAPLGHDALETLFTHCLNKLGG
jgi:hypothetical protein